MEEGPFLPGPNSDRKLRGILNRYKMEIGKNLNFKLGTIWLLFAHELQLTFRLTFYSTQQLTTFSAVQKMEPQLTQISIKLGTKSDSISAATALSVCLLYNPEWVWHDEWGDRRALWVGVTLAPASHPRPPPPPTLQEPLPQPGGVGEWWIINYYLKEGFFDYLAVLKYIFLPLLSTAKDKRLNETNSLLLLQVRSLCASNSSAGGEGDHGATTTTRGLPPPTQTPSNHPVLSFQK